MGVCSLVDRNLRGLVVVSLSSKPYVLFSATDAASASIDFFESNVDDGVVDSPPS